MKSFILSEHNLRALDACQSGINFLKATGLINMDYYKLKISGDYEGYVDWLKHSLQSEYIYNNQGQIIERRYLSGDSYRLKYNDKGQLIEKIYSNESIYKYRYNDQGQMIEEILPSGNINKLKYNNQGWLIKEIYSDEDNQKFIYNDKGRLIEELFPDGYIIKFIYNNQNRLQEILCNYKSIMTIEIEE